MNPIFNKTILLIKRIKYINKKFPMENNFEKQQLVETSFDENQLVNLKEKKETQANVNTSEKTTVINTGPELKYSNSTSYEQLSTDYLRFFFHSKEFVIEWLTKLSFKPTPLSIICSTTIYLFAICSTIQRKEGDRWFTFLINAKMPGYHMLYQDVSWETFENISSKHLNTGSNYLVSQNNRSSYVQSSRANSTIPSDPFDPGLKAKLDGFSLSPIKYVDLYKDKALIFLNTPLEKQVRKDFIGFYVKKPSLEDVEKGSTKNNQKNIVLPWFKIGACNRYSRTIIPKLEEKFRLCYANNPAKENPDFNTDFANVKVKKEMTNLLDVSTSMNSLRPPSQAKGKTFIQKQKQALNVLTPKNCNTLDQTQFSQHCHNNLIEDRICGLQYLFPFYRSKESVYAESDSIPFKLESPYSTNLQTNRVNLQSFVSSHNEPTWVGQYSATRKKELLSTLKCKKTTFLGKYVINFQDKLQNLFYSYGFSPPSHVKRLAGSASDLRPASDAGKIENVNFAKKSETKSNQTYITVQPLSHILADTSQSNLTPSDSHIETLVNELCTNAAHLASNKQVNKTSRWFDSSLAKWNLFERNNLISTRLMSGYKLPEYTKLETNSLFRKFILPHLLISSSINFSSFYLINQIVLRPLYIKLPPALPFSFFTNLASSLCIPASIDLQITNPTLHSTFHPSGSAPSETDYPHETKEVTPYFKNLSNDESNLQKKIAKGSHINITYKQLSLQELKEVKDLFIKLGRDYEEYLSLPKDSAPAIRISPSLEDDKILKLEAERKEKKDDEKPTRFEQLQTLRGRERKFEQGKSLRPFAYKNQLAFETDASLDFQSGKNMNEENSWIRFKLGSENLLSDRKYSFFGRKDISTKRLIAQEQKEINEQITKSNYQVPGVTSQSHIEETAMNDIGLFPKTEQGMTKKIDEETLKSKSYRKLQRKARKGLIKLLGSLDFSAHHLVGSQDRTRKPNLALRGKVIKSAYSHLRWQKKRFHSRLLGTPSQRHLIMPNITLNDWKKILEWQLQNYFFLEEQRLQPLMKDNPEKTFKIRQLQIYLPWVTIRTPLNKPFQWPLTRLDYADYLKSHTTNTKGAGAIRDIEKATKKNAVSSSVSLTSDAGHDVKQELAKAKQVKVRNSKFSSQPLFVSQKTVLTTAKKFQQFFSDSSYKSKLPIYNPVYYWDSGKAVSLSNFISSSLVQKKGKEKQIDQQINGNKTSFKRENLTTIQAKPVIQTRVLNEPYLCEPLTNQSWLLVYRLFLIFALKNLLKYIYRISLKDFIIKMANSDFGLMVTSPEMREWLENAGSKSFYTPRKRLQDIAAIEENIPTLSDIIWYLRNYGRGRTGAHGLLLVGPAGAEKTSVVQAIAGECEVPVIVQSMSALAFTFDDPYERLEKVFKQARQQAPCVLFLDDLDAMGQSRAHVITNDIGAEDLLFSLDTYTAEGKLCFANLSNSLHTGYSQSKLDSDLLSQPDQNLGKTASFLHSRWNFNPLVENPIDQPNLELLPEQESETNKTAFGASTAQSGQNLATFQQNQEFQTRKLNLLLRLLTEMDGISPLNGVVIVATSERPALLDPALVRAGRFERRIYMSLPNKERRIQLFKRETKLLGHIHPMPWDHLGLRTTNMSGADIFSAINHSAIRAILDNTVHTIETLEHGLNCVNGLPNKKRARSSVSPLMTTDIQILQNLPKFSCTSFKSNDPFHKSRLAFYQAGKAVLHNLLLDHPKLGVLNLDELANTINRNSSNIGSTSKSTIIAARTRIQFETRLIGLYAGKAAEMLHLSSNNVCHSIQPFIQLDLARRTSKQTEILSPSNKQKASIINSLTVRQNINIQQKLFRSSLRTASKQKFEDNWLRSPSSRYVISLLLLANKSKSKNLNNSNFVSVNNKVVKKDSASTNSHLSNRTKRSSHFLLNSFGSTDRSRIVLSSKKQHKNKTSGWLWQSNLGFSELLTASSLTYLMIDRWYLYSQKLFTFKINKIISSLNHEQMKDETLFPLAKRFSKELEFDLLKPAFWGITLNAIQDQTESFHNNSVSQKRNKTHWWEAKVCQALEMGERPYGKWYRIYLPKVEERELNEEWVPPDSIIHQSLTLSNISKRNFPFDTQNRYTKQLSGSNEIEPINKNRPTNQSNNAVFLQNQNHILLKEAGIPSTFYAGQKQVRQLRWQHFSRLIKNKEGTRYLKTLNDFYLFERDLSYQNAVINCFYTAFNLLNENRELLDLFADHLTRFKILRSHEITKICSLFFSFSHSKSTDD